MTAYDTIHDIQDQIQMMRERGVEPKQVTLSVKAFEEIAKLLPKKNRGVCVYCGSEGALTKGLCWNCYSRYRRKGTPEYGKIKYDPISPSRESELKRKWQVLKDLDFSPLSSREENYLRLHYEKCKEFQDIGNDEGISRQRVHQVVQTALKRLAPQLPEGL